jgi:adenosylcobinamide-GDP ribazoletransferase
VPDFRLFLRRWLAALRDLTRIPVRGGLAQWADLQPGPVAESSRHEPGAGVVVGMAACMVFAIVSLPLPQGPLSPLVAAVASTIATVLLTGGREERGLARWAERAVDDPWGGTLTLMLVLAAKLALLAVLAFHSGAGVMAALLAAHAVSRFWPLLLGGTRAVAIAAAWCLVPLLLMVLAGGLPFVLLPLAASGLVFAVLRKRARQDGVHALQQIGEVAFYLGAAFGVPR